MSLPTAVISALEETLGKVTGAQAVGGGCISSTAKARLAGGREVFVKWHTGREAVALFSAERRGLELLHAAQALRIPAVLAYGDGPPAFLALEWLEQGAKSARGGEALGSGLAALHRVTGDSYGLDHDNFIGANPQPNRPADNWVTFFQEQRIGFQMELAGYKGYLNSQRAKLLEKLLGRLGDWLPAKPPASLLHGDLWGGNWLATADDEPALIDPAVYYGDREAELAFTRLFGGFPGGFYAAYTQAWPLEPGYQEREDLYNLYHLLNHLNLFGEGYGGSVDSILRQYVG
jgi:fructosamine-3-kinase